MDQPMLVVTFNKWMIIALNIIWMNISIRGWNQLDCLRKVLKKDASQVKLDEKEKTQLRGLIASLNWTSREGRPDASAAASILASAFPETQCIACFVWKTI